ncbi:molybdopterin-binding protein [Niameybacter massiliensis]|uniref:molybdopterin-binding protein n=1 Tax=Niameybacter massiliensis TaxID=1658108 RepID=UPI0006B5D0F4|nr:molybdopterin-binding protein [Niameybacter massiliensis]
MRKIKTVQAVGHILCHDITQIIKDEKKGVLFKKGHQVKEEDIEKLLSVGKDHLYVWEYDSSKMHENEAALILKEVCAGEGTCTNGSIQEGKIELFAKYSGLLDLDVDRLLELNGIEEIVVATRHRYTPVQKGEKLAGMRVIPLVIDQEKMLQIRERFGTKPLISVKPYTKHRVGIVTTGNEVYYGRIKDTFGSVIKGKLEEYGLECCGQTFAPDDANQITEAIEAWIQKGATMVICTGGMSVDPDDVTPAAIRQVGGKIVSYGAPVLPGAMFLLSYKGEIPILGLPGCVMYAKRTVFDLLFPRIIAGERLEKKDIAALGHGGLCLNCSTCTFPSCSLGKGV